MTDNREKMIQTIKKLLSLASNNPSENEAIASALKAQQLMAKYNIEDYEIAEEVKEEPIENIMCDVGTGKKWKYNLGSIIAKNFRCKCWYKGSYGINFYGHVTDIKIAEQVFLYLFKTGDTLAGKYVREKKREQMKQWYGDSSVKGIYNSFVVGFLQGIQKRLEKQSKALMVIVPPEVSESYEEYSSDFGIKNTSIKMDDFSEEAYKEGFFQGKQAMDGRELESKNRPRKVAVGMSR